MTRRRTGPVVVHGDGTFSLELDENERTVLGSFIDQYRDLLSGDRDDPRLHRLFPAAYSDDNEANSEYRRFMDDELVAARMAMLEKMEKMLEDGARFTDDSLGSLMITVNSLRLVLGTALGIDHDEWEPEFDEDDEDDPEVAQWHVYNWLGWLLEWVVEARQEG